MALYSSFPQGMGKETKAPGASSEPQHGCAFTLPLAAHIGPAFACPFFVHHGSETIPPLAAHSAQIGSTSTRPSVAHHGCAVTPPSASSMVCPRTHPFSTRNGASLTPLLAQPLLSSQHQNLPLPPAASAAATGCASGRQSTMLAQVCLGMAREELLSMVLCPGASTAPTRSCAGADPVQLGRDCNLGAAQVNLGSTRKGTLHDLPSLRSPPAGRAREPGDLRLEQMPGSSIQRGLHLHSEPATHCRRLAVERCSQLNIPDNAAVTKRKWGEAQFSLPGRVAVSSPVPGASLLGFLLGQKTSYPILSHGQAGSNVEPLTASSSVILNSSDPAVPSLPETPTSTADTVTTGINAPARLDVFLASPRAATVASPEEGDLDTSLASLMILDRATSGSLGLGPLETLLDSSLQRFERTSSPASRQDGGCAGPAFPALELSGTSCQVFQDDDLGRDRKSLGDGGTTGHAVLESVRGCHGTPEKERPGESLHPSAEPSQRDLLGLKGRCYEVGTTGNVGIAYSRGQESGAWKEEPLGTLVDAQGSSSNVLINNASHNRLEEGNIEVGPIGARKKIKLFGVHIVG